MNQREEVEWGGMGKAEGGRGRRGRVERGEELAEAGAAGRRWYITNFYKESPCSQI